MSNFLAHHVQALMEDGEIAPMVNQIEYHPGFGQVESADFCQKNGIVVQAWSPFGTGDVLKNSVLSEVAAKYGKTAAQVALRFLIQSGVAVIPKSVHMERIKENFDIFDFELSAAEMEQLRTLDKAQPMIGNAENPDKVEFAMTW